ncbi:MAG: aminotransferase class IV [Phycisphaerae bacterium]|nr:aminotransferase class IV [Phycisphaerae bacterium]
MGKVFLNDSIVEAGDAKIAADDGGFLYGQGLFETMRAVGGEVFRVDDHLDRLFASCEKLNIKTSYERDDVKDGIAKVLEANELTEARVRVTVSGGAMSSEVVVGTLLVTAVEFAAYPAEYYTCGVTVTLCDFRQNSLDPLVGHKTTNYFSRLIALQQAHSKKAAENLWFTTDNKLAEGCVSNVFIVKDDILLTPRADTPVLPGIARKTVLEIAAKEKIAFEEKDLFINDLLEADEVFVTNSIMTVLPVATVEAHAVRDGKPGEVTKYLLGCYKDMLEGKQAEGRGQKAEV